MEALGQGGFRAFFMLFSFPILSEKYSMRACFKMTQYAFRGAYVV